MFNLNSPTIQAMLKDIPQGVGNMPVYYGNTPTVEDVTQNYQQPQQQMYQQPYQQPVYQQPQPEQQQQPTMMYGQQNVYQQPYQQPMYQQPNSYYQGVQPQACTPYPSPKEMLMQSGPYMPTTFSQPRNIVGAYNPGYNQAFSGYYNPYMGQGYSGYGYGAYAGMPREVDPRDQNSLDTYRMALMNGVTYQEQIENEMKLYKACSRMVSRALGRSEEEAEKCEKTFDSFNPFEPPKPDPEVIARQERHAKQHIVVKITKYARNKDGEMVEVASKELDSKITCPRYDYNRNVDSIHQGVINQSIIEANLIARNNYLYDNAIERQYDNYDLVDFFNKAAGHLMSDTLLRRQAEMERNLTALFDRDRIIDRIRHGKRSKVNIKAEDNLIIRGVDGIMPDGRPVSPGVDPSIARSFSYNPATGQYFVEAPGFIKDRLDKARSSFIKSLDGGNKQVSIVKES